jgi:hypothetical protein
MARPTVIDENENESVQSAAGSDHQDAPETSQAAASRAEQSADQSAPTFKRRESRMTISDLSELIPHLRKAFPAGGYPEEIQQRLHDLGRRVTDENEELIRGYNELIHRFDALADKSQQQEEEINAAQDQILTAQQNGKTVERTLSDHEKALRDKDVVITYLQEQLRGGSAGTMGSSDSSASRSKRTAKLPDPPALSDGETPKYEDWAIQMKHKMKANADHYPTDELRMGYVLNRCEGAALAHIRPRLSEKSAHPYTKVEEMFKTLEDAFADHNKRRDFIKAYNRCYQGKQAFRTFWAEFQRLATELEMDTERMKEDLLLRVNAELAAGIAMLDTDGMTIYQIADRFHKADAVQRDVAERMSRRLDRAAAKQGQGNANSGSNSGSAAGKEGSAPRLPTASNDPPPGALSSRRPPRAENPDPEKERYMKLGLCYRCGKQGHRSRECPNNPLNTTAGIREVVATDAEEQKDEGLEPKN